MERMFDVAAGIDVHRDTVVVTVRRRLSARDDQKTRTFETFRDSLVEMTSWLTSEGAQVVGLESTGVYWQPVVRALKEHLASAQVWLLNASHVKQMPGRKSDVTDSQWLSRLVMYGHVSPSFLPSADLCELRKLTRHRTKVVADHTRYKNRIIKELEASGVKLASVCSDPLGQTARAILDILIEGEDVSPNRIAAVARGKLRRKVDLLARAVRDTLTPSTAIVLRQMLVRLDSLDVDICALDAEITRLLQPYHEHVARLCEIPGIDRVAAGSILAETGPDLTSFPTPRHLASWAGLSPGSNESAGKAKPSPTRKGNKYLRTILVQCATSAKGTKETFWQRRYRQLVRLGPKKATVALARRLLHTVYAILKFSRPYKDPELASLPPQRLQRTIQSLTTRLEGLGFQVTLQPRPSVS
jgi:transposase